MRFKYLFLSLMLLILACSITAIAAADDYESLGDYTFDIPDGYSVVNKTDEMVMMQSDEDHAVVVYKLDAVSDFDLVKSLLEDAGCEFSDEETFQAGSFDVSQYSYNYTEIQGTLYVCNDGGNPILVAEVLPVGEDSAAIEGSPAKQVVDSLE